MSAQQESLNITNNNAKLSLDGTGIFDLKSKSIDMRSTIYPLTISTDNSLILDTNVGNTNITNYTGNTIISSFGNTNTSLQITALNTSSNLGGIVLTAGSGGITSNALGNINILSKGSNINIGVSPSNTALSNQTQNITMQSLYNIDLSTADFSLVTSDVINIISNTGDINIGSDPLNPIIKFENGNLLINQPTSTFDYQVDVNISSSSNSNPGYNGILTSSNINTVASEFISQTHNLNSIISLGVQPENSNNSIYTNILAYKTNNLIIPITNNFDFTKNDIGKYVYWNSSAIRDLISNLTTTVIGINDSSNITIYGTYTGSISTPYLLQIDSVPDGSNSTVNTFKWSSNGGDTFNSQFIPCATSNIILNNGLSVAFSSSNTYYYQQQFIFYAKIGATVEITGNISMPETLSILQPYYSYINTITPNDLVISTNNNEKMRITGDGAIGIQTNHPSAGLHVNSHYGEVMMVNQLNNGYQINPELTSLSSGGYIITWASQTSNGSPSSTYDIYTQRYLTDGNRYRNNILVSNEVSGSDIFPAIANHRSSNKVPDDHYIVVWASNYSNLIDYDIYCKIYHNNTPLNNTPILVNQSSLNYDQLYPRVAGLGNGNYAITWASDTSANSNLSIYARIIQDNGTFATSQFLVNQPHVPALSQNYPWVSGLSSSDPYFPNGFVISYLSEMTTNDDRYKLVFRVFASNGTTTQNEVIVAGGINPAIDSISDGLQSSDWCVNGGFLLAFYQNYNANNSLYALNDTFIGLSSGVSGQLNTLSVNPNLLPVKTLSSRSLLLGEEISIGSSITSNVIIERIESINYTSTTTGTLTLNNGHRNIRLMKFPSNSTSNANASLDIIVNDSKLYDDKDRTNSTISNSSIFAYKRPLATVSVDDYDKSLVGWTNGAIPNIYYRIIDSNTGNKLYNEISLTTNDAGLKKRNPKATYLSSIAGDDYGFVISWDNQNIDLSQSGIYHELISNNKHNILLCQDSDNITKYLTYNHHGQFGINTNSPNTSLHLAGITNQNNILKLVLPNSSNNHIIANDKINYISVSNNYPIIPNGIINPRYNIDQRYQKNGIIFSNQDDTTLSQIIGGFSSAGFGSLSPAAVNLIGYFPMDEIGEIILYNYAPFNTNGSTNSNFLIQNCDIENCRVDGIINGGLIFNGVNNYALYPENNSVNLKSILGSNDLSISIWMKIPSNVGGIASNYCIISNGADFTKGATYSLNAFDTNSNGTLYLRSTVSSNAISNITISDNTIPLNDNNWHNVVLTIDSSSISSSQHTISIYVDNILKNSNTLNGVFDASLHSTDNIYLASSNGSAQFYRGWLDELKIWNKTLSTADINQLYNYGSNISGGICIHTKPIDNNSFLNKYGLWLENGNILNTSVKPRSATAVNAGAIIQYSGNNTIVGSVNTFTSQFNIGDLMRLYNSAEYYDYTICKIIDSVTASMNTPTYTGIGSGSTYAPLILPAIQYWHDDTCNTVACMDYYGRMSFGIGQPSSRVEILGDNNSGNNNTSPYLTLTNTYAENINNGRRTGIRFRGNTSGSFTTLGLIEIGHDGTGNDNKGLMKFKVNSSEYNAMIINSNGWIGIGDQSNPVAKVDILESSLSTTCKIIMESNYLSDNGNISIFSEASDIFFSGVRSSTEASGLLNNTLAMIKASRDTGDTKPDGRFDFYTNNNSGDDNGLESKLTINRYGYVGINILQPSNVLEVAPEIRLADQISLINTKTVISNSNPSGSNTIIGLNNGIFATLSAGDKSRLVGGSLVVQNSVLGKYSIIDAGGINSYKLTVAGVLSNADIVGYNATINYPGLNVTTNGMIGIGINTPTSALMINGSLSKSIISTASNLTLDNSHYTICANSAISDVYLSLPTANTCLGRCYNIKKINSGNTVYIAVGSGTGNVIDGSPTVAILTQYSVARLQGDGINSWWIL